MAESLKPLYFLVIANEKVGMGHLARCLMLANEARQQNISVTFLCPETSPPALQKISDAGFYVHEVPISNPSEALKSQPPGLLVIDIDAPWAYDEKWQHQVKEYGFGLWYITIHDQYTYWADVVMNPNILAETQTFRAQPQTHLLLGPNYFILHPKFQGIRRPTVAVPSSNLTILVTFGGSDPAGLTQQVVASLALLPKGMVNSVLVVVGPLYAKVEELKNQLVDLGLPYTLHQNIPNLELIMLQCDLAITSSGLTYWELSALNIPSLTLSASVREKRTAEYLHEQGYTYLLGHFDAQPTSAQMANTLQGLIEAGIHQKINTVALADKINLRGIETVIEKMKGYL